jgi:hypothetical protein
LFENESTFFLTSYSIAFFVGPTLKWLIFNIVQGCVLDFKINGFPKL